jgi:uroporphyrin-III C-methyltransferase/precorrin-2 dehydrogenase/sirohydrochlorin ferrochelatase
MVSNVSRRDERWAGSIADLGWASERRDPTKPVIIGVGRVFEKAARIYQREHEPHPHRSIGA